MFRRLTALTLTAAALGLAAPPASSAQTYTPEPGSCLQAIADAQQNDGVLTPDEFPAINAVCIPAIQGVQTAPQSCQATRPDSVTCGYPVRRAVEHPVEFARYARVRRALVGCRYTLQSGSGDRYCRRLVRKYRARWMPGAPPEQVRFRGQVYDWIDPTGRFVA